MSIRVATYFPFNVTCYLNGHSFVAQELRRDGVRFRKADNAFVAVEDVHALQAAADRLSAAILQRRCAYWVRQLVPTFTETERQGLQPGYRYCMAQMELATDLVFKRAAPLQTVLDQRNVGHPVLRWYYQTSFAKNYTRGDQHVDRILRAETCSNDTRHFGVGRRLENLPLLRTKPAATNERTLGLQAELVSSAVDTGQLASLPIGQPGQTQPG